MTTEVRKGAGAPTDDEDFEPENGVTGNAAPFRNLHVSGSGA